MELLQAKAIADKIYERFLPYCDRIHIAGSVRREKAQVGDIEIVAQAKNEESKDMFGNIEYVIRSPYFQEIAETQLGKVIKGKPDGRYMQIELPEGINLDLFMPEPYDYYRQFAIRTGSSDYSFKVIATAWKALGWVGTENGLRKMSECVEKKLADNKSKWDCNIGTPSLPPAWNSEQEFFDWLRVKWIEPKLRTI